MDKETTNKVVIGVALGFLVGFGSAWIWLDQSGPKVAGEKKDEIPLTESNESKDENTEMKSELLIVSDQTAGDIVVVDKANLEEPAWVVVYEDSNGELGSILGARLFDTGETVGKEVYLLRATRTGSRYYTLFHRDSGDRQFDYKEDIAMREKNSDRLIITSFEAK